MGASGITVALAAEVVLSFPPIVANTLDPSSNSWVFAVSPGDTTPDTGLMVDAAVSFYNAVGTGMTNTISAYLAASVSRAANACTAKVYDISTHLNGGPKGSPVYVRNFTLASAALSTSGLPAGACSTLSFKGAYGTDVEFGTGARPRARDRGRLYIGPLCTSAVDTETTSNRVKLTTAYMANLALSAEHNILNGTNGTAGHLFNWNVWSRKNAALKVVTDGWIDDRPDYQRRREDLGLHTELFSLSTP